MFKVGDKVGLQAKPDIKGVIVDRPENSKRINFFDNPDILWLETPGLGIAWAYKSEVALESVTPEMKVVKTKVKAGGRIKAKKAPKVSVTTVDFRRLVAVDLIRKQRGKFFTAIFTGKDGAEHICNGRTGVVKYLKGEVIKQLPDDLLNVFNVKKMAYRNVFLDNMKEIRAEGKVFTFD